MRRTFSRRLGRRQRPRGEGVRVRKRTNSSESRFSLCFRRIFSRADSSPGDDRGVLFGGGAAILNHSG